MKTHESAPTTPPPISSIQLYGGVRCATGYLVQFVLTDEAEYRAWMEWLRNQRKKGLESAPVFSRPTWETAP